MYGSLLGRSKKRSEGFKCLLVERKIQVPFGSVNSPEEQVRSPSPTCSLTPTTVRAVGHTPLHTMVKHSKTPSSPSDATSSKSTSSFSSSPPPANKTEPVGEGNEVRRRQSPLSSPTIQPASTHSQPLSDVHGPPRPPNDTLPYTEPELQVQPQTEVQTRTQEQQRSSHRQCPLHGDCYSQSRQPQPVPLPVYLPSWPSDGNDSPQLSLSDLDQFSLPSSMYNNLEYRNLSIEQLEAAMRAATLGTRRELPIWRTRRRRRRPWRSRFPR